MMRWTALLLIMLALSVRASAAACLPTLGMEDCFRAWDPAVQAIEHKYLDVPLHAGHPRHGRWNRDVKRKPDT